MIAALDPQDLTFEECRDLLRLLKSMMGTRR
jgi:hypothetical protein